MKYVILLFLSTFILFANDKQKVTIGLGPYIQTQPYKNVDAKILPSPVIFFDNSIFYMRWTQVGLYFLGDKNEELSWAFSLTALPRVYGYESSDIEGMNERESTWEGGIAFIAKTDKTFLEMMLVTDMLDRHDSWVFRSEIGYELKYAQFTFYPRLIGTYLSDEIVNYYYGLTDAEAQKRSEVKYVAGDGFQLATQVYIEYPFTDQLSALVNLRADKLPSSVTKSTIVEDDYIYSGLASLIYTFEY